MLSLMLVGAEFPAVMLGVAWKESQRAARSRKSRAEARPLQLLGLATSEGAGLVPNHGNEVDGEKKKYGFDGVAVFGDGINEIIRKRVDDEGGGIENPAAGPPGKREQEAEPAEQRKRPKLPRLPPFASLIEKRCAVPKPPGAMKSQFAEFRRILVDKAQGVLLPVIDVRELAPLGIFLKFGWIGGRVPAGEAHAIAGVIVAEVKFEPKVAPKKNGSVEDEFVADQPGRDKRGEERSGKGQRSKPGTISAVVFESGVKKSERHQGKECRIGERG